MVNPENIVNIANIVSLQIYLRHGAYPGLYLTRSKVVILYFLELYLFTQKFMDSSEKLL